MLSAIMGALSGLAIPPNHNVLPVPEVSGEATLAPVGLVCGKGKQTNQQARGGGDGMTDVAKALTEIVSQEGNDPEAVNHPDWPPSNGRPRSGGHPEFAWEDDVPECLKNLWPSLSDETRLAVYIIAGDWANYRKHEYWGSPSMDE